MPPQRVEPPVIQACINGNRSPAAHLALDPTPRAVAAEARAAVAAGASTIHVHPKDPGGSDTLLPRWVDSTVRAIREQLPSRVPVGVTTGIWASGGRDRRAYVDEWTILPDFASVNWHEPGAELLATHLLDRGIEVEAGLRDEAAIDDWLRWDRRTETTRALIEIADDARPTPALLDALLDRVRSGLAPDHGSETPILLHGEDACTWMVLEHAANRGTQLRIGLEDTLRLPDGARAADNAELVRHAVRMLNDAASERTS